MTLKLSALSRSRLWTDVQGQGLFVPTTDALAAGEAVTVDVEAPDLPVPLSLTGVVDEVQALSGRQAAGVWVTLDEPSVQRCRAALGFERDERARVAGRSEARIDCDLEARLLQPVVAAGCHVRSMSKSGLTLRTPSALEQGAKVGLAVTLPDGEVLLRGEVAWTRPELSLCGLQLTDLAPDVAARLDALIGQQGAREAPAAAPVVKALEATVLVADDDPAILEFATLFITKSGYRAVRAERGDEALELARRERPALMLLDVLMPGLDGLEVCRAVREDAVLKDTPVVLLSAMGETRLAEAAGQVGASAWVTKPMRLDALRELFGRLIPK